MTLDEQLRILAGDALAPIPPHVAAARVLLAETDAGKDPDIGAWLRALAHRG